MVRVLWLPWLGAEELKLREEEPQRQGRESRMGSQMGTDLFAGLVSAPASILRELCRGMPLLHSLFQPSGSGDVIESVVAKRVCQPSTSCVRLVFEHQSSCTSREERISEL